MPKHSLMSCVVMTVERNNTTSFIRHVRCSSLAASNQRKQAMVKQIIVFPRTCANGQRKWAMVNVSTCKKVLDHKRSTKTGKGQPNNSICKIVSKRPMQIGNCQQKQLQKHNNSQTPNENRQWSTK